MDPQQRILLEVCHETFTTAETCTDLTPPQLPIPLSRQKMESLDKYIETGVYVGLSYNEYAQAIASAIPGVSTYTATGGSLSVAAGNCPCIFFLLFLGSHASYGLSSISGLVCRILPHKVALILIVTAHAPMCIYQPTQLWLVGNKPTLHGPSADVSDVNYRHISIPFAQKHTKQNIRLSLFAHEQECRQYPLLS